MKGDRHGHWGGGTVPVKFWGSTTTTTTYLMHNSEQYNNTRESVLLLREGEGAGAGAQRGVREWRKRS